jgi:hypothetical protein
LQNSLIQTSQAGGQWYSDTSPFSIPWFRHILDIFNYQIFFCLWEAAGNRTTFYPHFYVSWHHIFHFVPQNSTLKVSKLKVPLKIKVRKSKAAVSKTFCVVVGVP